MRLLIFFTFLAAAASAFENEELFKENESLDKVIEKKAYFAFKLKDSKLERRVQLAQDLSRQTQKTIKDNKILDITTGFVINATFTEIGRALCSAYPRFLTFNRFALDIGMIRGHLQNANMGEQAISKILIDNGFTYRPTSDVAGGDKSGFAVVKNNAAYKVRVTERGQVKESVQIHPAAKVFLQKPLRTSVYIDTLSVCRENIFGNCDEIASIKIESCKKSTKTVIEL